MPTCNRFYARRANSGRKITIFLAWAAPEGSRRAAAPCALVLALPVCLPRRNFGGDKVPSGNVHTHAMMPSQGTWLIKRHFLQDNKTCICDLINFAFPNIKFAAFIERPKAKCFSFRGLRLLAPDHWHSHRGALGHRARAPHKSLLSY